MPSLFQDDLLDRDKRIRDDVKDWEAFTSLEAQNYEASQLILFMLKPDPAQVTFFMQLVPNLLNFSYCIYRSEFLREKAWPILCFGLSPRKW